MLEDCSSPSNIDGSLESLSFRRRAFQGYRFVGLFGFLFQGRPADSQFSVHSWFWIGKPVAAGIYPLSHGGVLLMRADTML